MRRAPPLSPLPGALGPPRALQFHANRNRVFLQQMKLADARRYALSLPEVKEAPHFQYPSFRVREKIFVTIPPDEEHLHIFVGDEIRDEALALHGEFLEKLRWGGKVVGLRVSLATAKPSAVKRLIQQAWSRKAPPTLRAAGKTSLK